LEVKRKRREWEKNGTDRRERERGVRWSGVSKSERILTQIDLKETEG
jgi:hypothetical protein